MNLKSFASIASLLPTLRGYSHHHQRVGVGAAALVTVAAFAGLAGCSSSDSVTTPTIDRLDATPTPMSVGEPSRSVDAGTGSISWDGSASAIGSMEFEADEEGADRSDDAGRPVPVGQLNVTSEKADTSSYEIAPLERARHMNRGASGPGIKLSSRYNVVPVTADELTEAEHDALLAVVNNVLAEYGKRLTKVFEMQEVHSSEFVRRLQDWFQVVDPTTPLAQDITSRIFETIELNGNYLNPLDDGLSFRHVAFQIRSTPKFEPTDPDLWLFHWCGRAMSETVSIRTGNKQGGTPVAMDGYGILAQDSDRWWIRDLEVVTHNRTDSLPSLNCTR